MTAPCPPQADPRLVAALERMERAEMEQLREVLRLLDEGEYLPVFGPTVAPFRAASEQHRVRFYV